MITIKEATQQRVQKERPSETGRRLLAKRGLAFKADRRSVPDSAWRELDHDLVGDD